MDAPRGSADFEESDELQRLRRRAYGPTADIAGDAAAQARLSALEAAERRERALVVDAAAALRAPASERVPVPEPLEGSRPASTSVPQPVTGPSVDHDPDGGSVTEPDPAGVPIADSEPIDGAPLAPWWRRRRLLPWVIAAVAVLAAAIGIGVFVDDEPERPAPVAQLTPQGQPASASIPVTDEVLVRYGLTVADFVSYGSYGPLRIWSTTELENRRCIAVLDESHISVFECTAPSVDTIADIDMNSNELPPAPSGELSPYVRFVLHDRVVDVYRPKERGEFYGSSPADAIDVATARFAPLRSPAGPRRTPGQASRRHASSRHGDAASGRLRERLPQIRVERRRSSNLLAGSCWPAALCLAVRASRMRSPAVPSRRPWHYPAELPDSRSN